MAPSRSVSFRALAVAALLAGATGLAACGGQASDVAAASPRPAEMTFWQGFRDHPHGYLKAGEAPNALNYLPPAPADDSERGRADLAVHMQTRALQGTERWAIALADNEIETPSAPRAFDCATGVRFVPEQMPTLTYLLARMLPDLETIQTPAKQGYFRTRPFVAHETPICLAAEPWLGRSGSYPSGHSAVGWAWALTLAELAPDRADAILKRGLAYGESRVVCGVHFPSDIDAGRVVGATIVTALKANPQFQADFVVARAEFERARAAQTEAVPACSAALATPAY